MHNALKLREKLQSGKICVGTCVTFNDPTITEALSSFLDIVWIDMEHGPLTLETLQGHMMATKGSDATPIVRVPWNDAVMIKQVLDAGAAGVISPMICTEDEARRFVAACFYPPEGIRGFGPRRPSNYGENANAEFCRLANRSVIPIAQIEHIEGVKNVDKILGVPGLAAIMIGPFDLAGSMGHSGNPGHPEVTKAVEMVVSKAKKANIFAGIGVSDDPAEVEKWIKTGITWVLTPPDFTLLLNGTKQFIAAIRPAISR